MEGAALIGGNDIDTSDADADLDALCRELARIPDDAALKVRVARRLAGLTRPPHTSVEPCLHALLIAPEVDPIPVARAGWAMVEAAGRLPIADEAGASGLERDGFVLALLEETCVAWVAAERALTALRRWLLMSGRGPDFPRTVRALDPQPRPHRSKPLVSPRYHGPRNQTSRAVFHGRATAKSHPWRAWRSRGMN